MAHCRDCCWLDICKSYKPNSRLSKKACDFAIFKKHLPDMNGEILEIGHGKLKTYRKLVRRQGLKWKGVDPRWPNNLNVDHYKGTAANIPFPDFSQDWVFSFASIEHWSELGENPANGIREIWRVLKSGGKMLLSCPIHYHGSDVFFYFKSDEIQKWFDFWDWESIQWEAWRREADPLTFLQAWKEEELKSGRYLPKDSGTWYLEILAVKSRIQSLA